MENTLDQEVTPSRDVSTSMDKKESTHKSASKKTKISALLEDASSRSNSFAPEPIILNSDERPVILFSDDVEQVPTHYLELPELRGYVQCNGPECPLCLAGKKQSTRILVPAFDLQTKKVGVLSMTDNRSPTSLLPQLAPFFENPEPAVAFITRENQKFYVETASLKPGIYGGEREILAFSNAMDAGTVELAAIYPTYSNKELQGFPSIHEVLSLKGLIGG